MVVGGGPSEFRAAWYLLQLMIGSKIKKLQRVPKWRMVYNFTAQWVDDGGWGRKDLCIPAMDRSR